MFFTLKYEAKECLQFKALYHQVQMFVGHEGDYQNKVSYPQSQPEIAYDDFFIEIVHHGQVELPFWLKLGFKDLEEGAPEFFAQELKYISIISDQPFLDYNPGEDLADLFIVEKKENLYLGIGSAEVAPNLIKDVRLRDFSSFLYTLSKAPKETAIHQFTFKYMLSDGNTLTSTSRELNIRGE